ncbi:hypothetical protein CEUSTIGMA_g2384.t1 [Chlamydomonas eustigma]|uniref:Peptidase S8/S53 domain-containing protein n=1 Tax=Chlamydomonas eustigma TaxID=1157962 RepID=A0A250WVT8_9CHLO|nr:hypothetical protein CEUSTIGMA_g2384.t1 [Chlamydomonas eustigma]|eukprot:GAX74938.1 hypothetical protein CEUSTIGMA_g2384.t1 [Chlamydomonas eustigma]
MSILRQAKLGTHRTLQQGIANDDDVQQNIPRAAAQPSPWWGPLSTQQIYILSFGPGHIPCQQADQYQSGPSSHQQNEEQHLHQYVPSPSLQAEVTGRLHHMGGSLLSYLHPSAWMVLVTPSIVEQLQSSQGVCLAPLMPEHKLAPEWTQLMADLLPGSSYKRTGSHTQGEADTETMASFDDDMSSLTGDSDVGKCCENEDDGPSSLDNTSDTPADTGSVEGHQTMQGVKVIGGVRGSAWRMQDWGSGLKSASSLYDDAMHGSMLGQQEDIRQEEDTKRLQEEAAKQQGTVDPPGAAAPSSVYIHVHFPHLDTLDMSRLGLTHPHQHWTKSACNSKLALTREEEDGKDDEIRMLQKVTSPLRVRQCLRWLERNGTYCPVAAALQDWSLALKKEWSSQRELRDLAKGGAREQGSTDHAEGGAREQGSTDPCQVHMMHEHGALLLLACPEDLTWLLPWLSVQPSVKWISPAPAVRLHNLVAGAIVQTGNLTTTQSAYNADMHPFWQTGIDGSGQVIGCGDSGVDVYNCYFYDPNVPFTIVNNSTTGTQEFTSSTHRKLVLYLGLEDMVDGNGHGSHVAGTLLGSPVGVNVFTQPTLATGLAPHAKLAFIDLGKGSSDLIITYTDLTSYYPYAYGYGARVHSDSWGSSSSTYDSLAMSVDQYTWQYTDFLPIFAAGRS